MTTFHDPQPLSRRAARQSERGETPAAQESFSQQPPAAPQYYSDPAASKDMWDTTARRAAQLPTTGHRAEEHPSGRRAATPAAQPPAVAEPLTYSTQQRPQVPSYDGPSFRVQLTPETPQDALPPTQAIPQTEQPSYRVRDFSPEGRRAAPSAGQSTSFPPVGPPTDLDYHTAVRDAPPAPIGSVPSAFVAAPTPAPTFQAPPVVAAVPVEHTMSRREMRAKLQAEEQASLQSQQPVAPAQVQAPAVQAPAPAEELSPFDALFRSQAPEAPAAPVELIEPPLHTRPPEPAVNTGLNDAIAEFDSLTSQPAPAAEPFRWSPPVGHWSTQADLDDDFPENTISRTIGSGTTATSALVLPSIPMGNDIRGPLTGTGEIMLTGSIDLPRNLAATGQSDRFDNGGIDALFDLSDAEVISTDSSPVRAIRAVSTHTSGHGVTHTQKPKGTRALTALLIAASSMAVVVAGLLVAAFAFKLF